MRYLLAVACFALAMSADLRPVPAGAPEPGFPAGPVLAASEVFSGATSEVRHRASGELPSPSA